MARFGNILLVEDDPITVMVCDRIIKMSGFSDVVLSKQNGQDAIDHLQTIINASGQMPDIIFLDINMPVMNGWDFLLEFEKVKLQLTTIPRIFILSSTVDPEDYKKAAEFTTVEGFISKPLTQEHLKSVV